MHELAFGISGYNTAFKTSAEFGVRNACDRTLIAGDAFITTKQESAYAVATQRPELHGPPMYFTPDWRSAASISAVSSF